MRVTLKGLDCPHCSAAIEKAVAGREEVELATLNYVTKELSIELRPATEEGPFGEWLKKFVHALEPDVEVILPLKEGAIEPGEEGREGAQGLVPFLKRHAPEAIGLLAFAASFAFRSSEAASGAMAVAAWLLIGYDVILKSIRNIAKGRVFDENFLMGAATFGAIALGDYTEAAAVMAFYKIGERLSEYASEKAVTSIEALTKLKAPRVRLVDGPALREIPTKEAKPGDLFLISPGEQAALDAVVEDGEGFVDTKSVTGEPDPVYMKKGDAVYAGYIATDRPLTLKAVKKADDSMIAKIIYLTKEAAANKAKTEKFISRFAERYTPAVALLAVALAVIPPLLGMGELSFWLRRALVFLVISCPCALVLSIPLGYFAGIGTASANGILVKGSNALEALSKADLCAFDKTGTLTVGELEIKEIHAKDEEAFADYIAAAELYSRHPIAQAFQKRFGEPANKGAISSFKEIAGSGVSLVYGGRQLKAGDAEFAGVQNPVDGAVYLTVDGEAFGYATLGDNVKADAKEAIAALHRLGVEKTVLLSGDAKGKVDRTAASCGIRLAYAKLDPKQKLDIFKGLEGSVKMYVGDGINDAPALAAADVGVAMGSLGSDAAIEAADVVIMNDSLSSLAKAVEIAKRSKSAIWQNIVGILLIKAAFLLLGALGLVGMGEAVFADVGVALLSVFNVLRIPAAKKFRAIKKSAGAAA
jgi:Cd2+/Zn2+-exporting ATPase